MVERLEFRSGSGNLPTKFVFRENESLIFKLTMTMSKYRVYASVKYNVLVKRIKLYYTMLFIFENLI